MNELSNADARPPTNIWDVCSPPLAELLTGPHDPRWAAARIGADPALRAEALQLSAWLQAATAPATADEIAQILAPLALVYGVGRAAESRAFWDRYVKALEGISARAIAAAADAYDRLPDSAFFPKPGPLRELAIRCGAPLARAVWRVRLVAAAPPPRPPITDAERAETRARIAELLAGFRSVAGAGREVRTSGPPAAEARTSQPRPRERPAGAAAGKGPAVSR